MAIPPRFAARRWGCAVCSAYPGTTQVFFHASPEEAAQTAAARAQLDAIRSRPGWTGPQRTDLPHGMWLCGPHGEAAAPFQALGRSAGLAALRAAVSDDGAG